MHLLVKRILPRGVVPSNPAGGLLLSDASNIVENVESVCTLGPQLEILGCPLRFNGNHGGKKRLRVVE